MFPASLASMVTAPPPVPEPHTVQPGTGTFSQVPIPPQQTAYGPVNARQENRIGDQNIDVSYEATDYGGLGTAAAILGVLALVALLVWWLL